MGSTGVATHDLRRMVQHGRMLDWAGESQYYVEPKRLARLGYLEARKEPGKTRDRTVYTLTDKGLERCANGRHAHHFTPVKSELLTRLLIADLVGEPATRESALALRGEIADLEARVATTEASAKTLPHRSKYLLLVTGYLRGVLALHRELVEGSNASWTTTRGDVPPGCGQPKNASASA